MPGGSEGIRHDGALIEPLLAHDATIIPLADDRVGPDLPNAV